LLALCCLAWLATSAWGRGEATRSSLDYLGLFLSAALLFLVVILVVTVLVFVYGEKRINRIRVVGGN